MKDKNISKISISSRKLDKSKAFKILELLDIDDMIMYIDEEYELLKKIEVKFPTDDYEFRRIYIVKDLFNSLES